MSLSFHGLIFWRGRVLIIGGLFAIEIWRAYSREQGGGILWYILFLFIFCFLLFLSRC